MLGASASAIGFNESISNFSSFFALVIDLSVPPDLFPKFVLRYGALSDTKQIVVNYVPKYRAADELPG